MIRSICTVTLLAGLVSTASAAVVPFTETFTNNASNWTISGVTPANWSANGGPSDSAHIFADTNVNAAAFGTVIALRGQVGNNASGGNFAGNWISEGVTAFSFDVYHNAPLPLTIGTRFASAANSPAAIGIQFAPVPSNTWTTVTIPIAPDYAGFISFSGSDFNTVFSSIGNVQLLFSVPSELEGTGTIVRFAADNVRIVPAPAALAALPFLAAVALRRRRN